MTPSNGPDELAGQARWLGHVRRAADAVRKAQLPSAAVIAVARDMVANRVRPGAKRIYVDVTEFAANTGEGSTARPALAALLRTCTPGYRIEPVRFDQDGEWSGYRFARQCGASLVGAPPIGFVDDVCEPMAGDTFVALARADEPVAEPMAQTLAAWRVCGVAIYSSIEALLTSGADTPTASAPAAWSDLASAIAVDTGHRNPTPSPRGLGMSARLVS